MASKALLIGMDRCEEREFPPLRYAEADARALAEALRECCGFQTDLLLGEAATVRAILSRLDRVGNGDALLLYFAGHGACIDDRYHLIPADGDIRGLNTLPVGTLWRRCHARLKSRHVFVVLDACRGPAGGPGPELDPGAVEAMTTLASGPRHVEVACACSAGEIGQDASELGQGLFAAALQHVLRQHTAALDFHTWIERGGQWMAAWCGGHGQFAPQRPWQVGPAADSGWVIRPAEPAERGAACGAAEPTIGKPPALASPEPTMLDEDPQTGVPRWVVSAYNALPDFSPDELRRADPEGLISRAIEEAAAAQAGAAQPAGLRIALGQAVFHVAGRFMDGLRQSRQSLEDLDGHAVLGFTARVAGASMGPPDSERRALQQQTRREGGYVFVASVYEEAGRQHVEFEVLRQSADGAAVAELTVVVCRDDGVEIDSAQYGRDPRRAHPLPVPPPGRYVYELSWPEGTASWPIEYQPPGRPG